MLLVDTSVIGR